MPADPFRTRDHVADFDGYVADYAAASAKTRAALPMLADVAYGDGPGERLDLFFPRAAATGPAPVHLFIHGGYWRMFAKEDFSFVAETVTTAGAIAVVVDYALMPAVRLGHIVDQMRRAVGWIGTEIARHGGDPARLTVSGHSAGAHLATFLMEPRTTASAGPATATLRGALLLGGIYDIAPLQHSFLAPLIGLTDDEVARFSPLRRTHNPEIAAMILHGAEETEPFHRQAADFRDHLVAGGGAAVRKALAGENHMSSVRALGVAESEAGRLLAGVIAAA